MRRKASPIPGHMTTGDYFTGLIRRHNWPPMFESRIDTFQPEKVLKGAAAAGSLGALMWRERQAALGIGWGAGTTPLPGTPVTLRPEWMGRTGH